MTRISREALLAGIKPGEILYAKLISERFGMRKRSVAQWFLVLKRSGDLVQLDHGIYQLAVREKVVEVKAKAVRKRKSRAVPKKPVNVVQLKPMPVSGIVQKAIASQPALAQAWGKMA
jgi:predicted dehydrogenase